MLSLLFGAKAQIVVGCLMVLATAVQTYLWLVQRAPTTTDVFLVSMEALLFAAYGVVATGLGFRATERVEAHVENADVIVQGDVTVED